MIPAIIMTNEANIEITGKLDLIGFLISIRNDLNGVFLHKELKATQNLNHKFAD